MTGPKGATQADARLGWVSRVFGSWPLVAFAWLSIAVAITTIALKVAAYLMTGSVGLLSDAAESVVNLVAAVVALIAIKVAAWPADHNHHYGHGKAEYFSAGVEGMMIVVAAGVIVYSGVDRLLHPQPLQQLGAGVLISGVASIFNGAVGLLLLQVGRARRSATLTADGHHLLTDVWTSIGVIVGVLLVQITGWQPLDSLVAIAVGINITVTGYRLVSKSLVALLDAALPESDMHTIEQVMAPRRSDQVRFVKLRTRQSGQHRFVTVNVQVPGEWSVERGHEVANELEEALMSALPDSDIQTHLEPWGAHEEEKFHPQQRSSTGH